MKKPAVNPVMKKLILDLDNTIYPVSSIGDILFGPLFDLLSKKEYGLSRAELATARVEIMRIPFQKVALQFGFSDNLSSAALKLLRNLRYDDDMNYFEEYEDIRKIQTDKFLLTTGFKNLQESKIKSLKIEGDFKEIFIVDPDYSTLTKKDIMLLIMDKYRLTTHDLLVIGDDPESEIKAASDLNIDTYLIDADGEHPKSRSTYSAKNLKDVIKYLD